MRHRKHNVGLNRTASHRRALLANLAGALFTHKKITTTLPKARAARSYAEKLITFARKGDLSARRQVLKKITDKTVVKELFDTIGPKFRERNGGYTRIIRLDNRFGDNAPMAILELVGFAVDDAGKKKTKKTAAKKTKAEKPDTKVKKTAAEPEKVEDTEKIEAAIETTEDKVEEASVESDIAEEVQETEITASAEVTEPEVEVEATPPEEEPVAEEAKEVAAKPDTAEKKEAKETKVELEEVKPEDSPSEEVKEEEKTDDDAAEKSKDK